MGQHLGTCRGPPSIFLAQIVVENIFRYYRSIKTTLRNTLAETGVNIAYNGSTFDRRSWKV